MDRDEPRVPSALDVGLVTVTDHHVGTGVETCLHRLEGSRVGFVRADLVRADHRVETIVETVMTELRSLPLGHAVSNDREAIATPERIEQGSSVVAHRRRGELALTKRRDEGVGTRIGVGPIANRPRSSEVWVRVEGLEGIVERLVVRFD